ncbi:O-antigen ligase family protein [Nocardioides massiliensis]|uniref:O-antigen ligase n=1 Tax=Nocardioides massiliensis TaxID=1325935 RepID=A0ABT9NM96_9ACTN|nr:O-antigen ligase family protein [Nocardioides massiliensis]MDP9821544.1 O-antigen ligase [Nocardioides massiliensis]
MPSLRAVSPARRRAGVAVIATSVLAVVIGAATALEPVLVLGLVVACTTVVVMTLRIETAVLVYIAVEPFSGYLTQVSSIAVKLVGLIVFVAWVLRLATDDRPPTARHPVTYAAGGLVLVVLAALVIHPNGMTGLVVATRYVSYVAVLIVLVDTLRNRLDPWLLGRTLVLSSTVAAVVGIIVFVNENGGRAAGPIEDANDFALHLLCALPFALALGRRSGAHRALWATAAVILVVAIAATFSRGGLLGLGVMLILALALQVLRWRTAMIGLAVVAVAVLVALVVAPDLMQRSLDEKQHVASANVTSRFVGWTLAAEMTADAPVLGKGPGGYSVHYDEYLGSRVSDPPHLDVAHQMFLDVASELGLVGLGVFAAMILAGLTAAWRARSTPGPEPDRRLLATTVCVAFAGVLTGAMFLSSQYYLPVWLLLALAAALTPARRSR